MKILTLIRDISTPEITMGWLSINGKKWATLERPWAPAIVGRGGMKGRSCVPPGEYQLLPHDTEAHPKVWALVNTSLDVYRDPVSVPTAKLGYARTAVLIHVANFVHELRGCIALGKTRGKDRDQWMVRSSRDAINELRAHATGADLKLIIENSNA